MTKVPNERATHEDKHILAIQKAVRYDRYTVRFEEVTVSGLLLIFTDT